MAPQPALRPQGVPEELLERLRPRLRGVACARGVPEEDAEDVIQNTLLALVDNWEEVRDPVAWSVGAVKKNCLMYWRSHRRRIYSTVDDPVLEWLAGGQSPAQERTDVEHDLRAMLSRIPDRYREVLELRYALGCEAAEVAERTGYRASSIGKVTSRSLRALGREMIDCGYRTAPRTG